MEEKVGTEEAEEEEKLQDEVAEDKWKHELFFEKGKKKKKVCFKVLRIFQFSINLFLIVK